MTSLHAQDYQTLISMIDLTTLSDSDTPDTVISLCRQAQSDQGEVAAVCVNPAFVATARHALEAAPHIGIATVVNFSHGQATLDQIQQQTQQAIADGATEIDMVIPYQALLKGDVTYVEKALKICRQSCRHAVLKIIIESGVLASESMIRQASLLAIEHGADFVKTSTGKTEVSATLEAAEIILEVIQSTHRSVGLKVSGGIKKAPQALAYYQLAQRIMAQTGSLRKTLE